MLTGIMLKKKAAFENYVVILISSLNQVCQDLLTIMIPPEYSSFAIPHGVSFSSERPTRPVENSWAIDGAETCADFLGSLDGFFSGAFRISKGQGGELLRSAPDSLRDIGNGKYCTCRRCIGVLSHVLAGKWSRLDMKVRPDAHVGSIGRGSRHDGPGAESEHSGGELFPLLQRPGRVTQWTGRRTACRVLCRVLSS